MKLIYAIGLYSETVGIPMGNIALCKLPLKMRIGREAF